MKLSTRIALAIGVTVPLLVLASGWLLYLLVARDLHAEQDAHLRERAAVVQGDARRLLRAAAAGRPAAELARERRLYASALDVGIRVTGPNGTVSGGPQPDARTRLPEAAPDPVTVRERGAGRAEGMPEGRRVKNWRVLSVHIDGRRPGVEGTLWLFSPDTSGQARLASVRRRVVVVAVAAAPVSALLAWAAASRASRPLRRLQQRTSGLDPRSDTSRLEHAPSGITEVDDLAATLRTVLSRYDEQAARTSQALATARSFSSAAAHELRTPLMSMQTNLEILAEHPELAGQDRDEVVEDLRQEHSRLLGLLVMLRRLGQGDLVEADAFAPLDLAEVAEAAVSDARRRDRTADVTFSVAAPGEGSGDHSGPAGTVAPPVTGPAAPGTVLTVHGWEPGLRSLLDNLVANALAHGRGADGRAHVEVLVRGGTSPLGPIAVLTVDDGGPGIPPEQRAAVFQRFQRGPGSTGSGLGLTLVAQQAALHRATVEIRDRPGGRGGTRVELRIPLADHEGTGTARAAQDLPSQRDWLIGAAPGTSSRTASDPQGIHKNGL
ncbi:two-component system, OmpR family, sensor histidine kinase PrrB [Streptomyces sp. WMMB 714]|uniref:sensor histidine kinase n=1 Tax=Streptomyces sp. WMMB 714 TaxID=1286822 RepID=UPI0005F827B9|nr:HAMP domain-containing sensor histidine kinase [Streptomyces sp. WMMB 714]SCK46496.1 two-component system, OmpR family, sensor histidine kinase PrrB [Streptomyces sp. WMMB 714]